MASMTDTTTAANTVTVRLTKPIITHKGELTEITLREPTVKSYLKAGRDPFQIRPSADGTDVTYDIPAMVAFLSDISGLDQIILEGLSARDFNTLRGQATTLAILGAGSSSDPSAP